jgi:citrate lyase subunit beta/citryl-CoA lyase
LQHRAQSGASTIYDCEHIDIAHIKTAREIIELACALNASDG